MRIAGVSDCDGWDFRHFRVVHKGLALGTVWWEQTRRRKFEGLDDGLH